MAMARPISATRNLTMTETSVTVASGQISRKVVGMATTAISSGTIAIHEAKTKASTSRAPPARDRGLDGQACATALVSVGSGGAQRIEPGDLHRRSADRHAGERGLGSTGLGLSRVDPAERRNGDQREGGAAVLGDEGPVVRRCVGGDSRVGQRCLHLGEGGLELAGDARGVDGGALRQRHDRHDRRDVAAVAVHRGDARCWRHTPRCPGCRRTSRARRRPASWP